MILSLIDYSKYKAQEANFKFWDELYKKLRFSKGALHYMKQSAKSDKSFILNSHVLERVKVWENFV